MFCPAPSITSCTSWPTGGVPEAAVGRTWCGAPDLFAEVCENVSDVRGEAAS
jgi:hypothetical protein